ncbi:unnamed protein product [Sphagnum balticum]
MANFECPECNICFAASHQRDGHRRLVHQSTCKIRTATGRIIVNRSIDGKYLCPIDYCKSTFERSDNLQCHFKVQHVEKNNSALNQNLDDIVQKAMSLGMLIQPPVEQTPELLRDVGLIVLNITDGIRLLLCKVCNICLEPKPCQVHTHLLGHDNRRAPKRYRNGRQRRVTTIPPVMGFASLFDEIEFTPLQDPRLERYTTSPPPEFLLVVPGITVVNGYRCKVDGCVYYCASRKTIANHRLANHFFLPVDASREPCQVQRLFKQVGYTAYFGVDHQNMELAGDSMGLQLKEQVHVSLHAHQCSTSNVAPNPSIRELSPWLRISRWHELAVNHIIPTGTPLDHVKQASILPTPIDREFNLDRLPLMVRAYLENAQTIISRVPYHLRRLVVFLEDSPVATVGLNQLWVPSTLRKYCALMTKLLITMVRSRDNSPTDDKPFVNVLGNLHSDLANALDDFVSYIQGRQDADRDDEDLVRIHTVLLHICRPLTCPVVQQESQTTCPIMRFLIVNSLKLDPSSTNLAFEHVRHVTGHIAILQYWWRCTILMQLVRQTWQPDHPAIPWCEAGEWLACVRDNAKDTIALPSSL